jgi:hypothetical protein
MKKFESTHRDLQQLYSNYRGYLGVYQWEHESDRWNELVAIALYEGAGVSPAAARRTVLVLEELGVRSPDALSDRRGKELIKTVLIRLGSTDVEATRASKLVYELARSARRRWDGHVQRLVRNHAKSILLDFKRAMSDVDADDAVIQRIGAVWLQNAFGIPLFHRMDGHLEEYMKAHGVTEDELIDIADATGISLPVLDDLIAVHSEDARTPAAADRPKRKSVQAKRVKPESVMA